MREFQILFDLDETAAPPEAAAAPYGCLSFPEPPPNRPWIYANFVQTLDGIVSLLGDVSGGFDIGGLPEDRWLMDLLRAHADAVMLGMGTLREEQRLGRPRPRGPVFRIVNPELRELRAKLGRRRERNVFVSLSAEFRLSDYAVFDGEYVDITVVTTQEGARKLASQHHPNSALEIIAVDTVDNPIGLGLDMHQTVTALHERHGINYLLSEGGPRLYSALLSAGLIDEKFLTVSPLEVGRMSVFGPRPNVLPDIGFSKEEAVRWHWLSCRRVGDYQFHRLRRKTNGIC